MISNFIESVISKEEFNPVEIIEKLPLSLLDLEKEFACCGFSKNSFSVNGPGKSKFPAE